MPNFFDKMIKARQANRLAHAFLLIGRGKEKEDAADKLAQWLLCLSPLIEGGCGRCQSCSWFVEGGHPDYQCLGEGDDTVRVEDLSSLHHFLEKTAHQSGYKVIKIEKVDQLSVYTANALLKSLEEPPERTVFLLLSSMGQRVLPTIRSRCVLIPLKTAKKPEWPAGMELDKIVMETEETLYLFYYWIAGYCRYALTGKAEYLSSIEEKTRYETLLKHVSVEKAMFFLDKTVEAMKKNHVMGVNKKLLWEALLYQWQQLQHEDGVNEHILS